MGYICVVPQYIENSKLLNSTAVLTDQATFDTITKTVKYLPCIHDAAFVQQQLWVSLIIWLSFVVFSILWVAASNRQNKSLQNDEMGFSLALRQWARKNRIAMIINRPVQLVASLGIYILLVNRCNYLSVDTAEYYIGLFLYLICSVDTLIRFCAAKQKITFVLSPYTILDVICLASYFCVGFAPSLAINGKTARTWLDFSIMRAIFVYRSYMEMDSHFGPSTRGIMLGRLAIRCFLLLAWAASVIFFIEMTGEIDAFTSNGFAHLYSCSNGTITSIPNDPSCGSETWSMMFALYFTVVTLGTVGYGDNSPHYLPSRLLIIAFILAGIILFSMEIQNLVNLIQLRQIGNPPYRPKSRTTQHLVVMGNPTFPQLSATLRELFHPDHFQGGERKSLHVVVLGDSSSRFTKGLIHKLKSEPKFASRVTFVAGDPTNDDDLERARIKDAIGAIFLPDKLAPDAIKEDARNIMHILSVKQYAGYDFSCYAIVLRNDNIRHMLAAGVERDFIVCEETMKMGVMAHSCACPGYSTFLSNLASCLSLDKNVAKSSWLRSKAHEGDVKMSFASQPWMEHYYQGASREFYVVSLSKEFADLTFCQAATKIFRLSKGAAVLIAAEVVVDDTNGFQMRHVVDPHIHGVRVVLNPGSAMRLKEGSSVYVIAEDLDSVKAFHITDDEDIQVAKVAEVETPHVSTTKPTVDSAFLSHRSSLRTPLLAQVDASERGRTVKPPRFRELLSGESMHLESTLERVVTSVRAPRIVTETLDPRRMSLSKQDVHVLPSPRALSEAPKTLEPPPIHILEDPTHIVICSFLGEESLAALQWFIAPLRGVFSLHMPPITILDATPPSGDWVSAISKFSNVYYVCGSPLVYQELQRAGAKSAHSVLVLAKKSKHQQATETSLIDADAIFTTMLVDLKMDPSRMFTLTELTDESNSKLLNKRFLIQRAPVAANDKLHTMWDIALSTFAGVHRSDYKKDDGMIFSMPLYMSGRLMHPQFCENLLVQSYYNPSIHRILRQLVGGPRSTGIICAVPLPRKYLGKGVVYGAIFEAFASQTFPGIALGLYRMTSDDNNASGEGHQLPVVLTCPVDSLEIQDSDALYVLYGWNVLEDAAKLIQTTFRAWHVYHRKPTLSRRKTTL
ncbi:Calcium-activated potassium channel subunit alpha-1 [Aphanomyces cochlioides]|nr:Calcium-activated potassium channel subunit alpha-1 [Aphanomyces cochlioides]